MFSTGINAEWAWEHQAVATSACGSPVEHCRAGNVHGSSGQWLLLLLHMIMQPRGTRAALSGRDS